VLIIKTAQPPGYKVIELTQKKTMNEVSIHRASPVCFYTGWLHRGL